MSFASPYLLATLIVPVLALLGYLWIERRPPRTAISFPTWPCWPRSPAARAGGAIS